MLSSSMVASIAAASERAPRSAMKYEVPAIFASFDPGTDRFLRD